MPLITIAIPTTKLDDKFHKTFDFFTRRLESEISKDDYEVIILTAENSGSPPKIAASNVTIIESAEPLYRRLTILTDLQIKSPLTALITSDDLWHFSKSDLIKFLNINAKIGLGNFLCVRPIDEEKVRLFAGWMQFRDYMPLPVSKDRMEAYIGEAPVTVWGLYDTKYLMRLIHFISDLLPALKKIADHNIIEDCINLVNLTQETCFLESSICIRFFDSNYENNPQWKLSLNCIKDIANTGGYGALAEKLSNFTKESKRYSESGLSLNEYEAGRYLLAHAVGYSAASSRKWRSWVDVEFYPFLPVQPAVIPNAGSSNKYDVAYRLSGITRPKGTFPSWAWIGNRIFINALYSVPPYIWALHGPRYLAKPTSS